MPQHPSTIPEYARAMREAGHATELKLAMQTALEALDELSEALTVCARETTWRTTARLSGLSVGTAVRWSNGTPCTAILQSALNAIHHLGARPWRHTERLG